MATSPVVVAERARSIGVVVIGRNEGARLETCLRSLANTGFPVVYVDSGSKDGSPERARALGASVVELDPSKPFTAARGRNEGFARLRAMQPDVELVQFLDGDTEVLPGWFDRALDALNDHDVVAVCGRRRERHPDASVYNALCDIEWNTPVGETDVFGGDVLMRAAAFDAAGGYDASLIAGEDPDLAVRLRTTTGKKILRIDADMTLHDAAMTSFSQWWTRALRGGHAFAEGAERHSALGFWRKEVRSNWAWGAALPTMGAVTLLPTLGTSAFVVGAGYATLFAKIRKDARRRGMTEREAGLYALFGVVAKIPQAIGQGRYWVARLRGKKSVIIEYKRM